MVQLEVVLHGGEFSWHSRVGAVLRNIHNDNLHDVVAADGAVEILNVLHHKSVGVLRCSELWTDDWRYFRRCGELNIINLSNFNNYMLFDKLIIIFRTARSLGQLSPCQWWCSPDSGWLFATCLTGSSGELTSATSDTALKGNYY